MKLLAATSARSLAKKLGKPTEYIVALAKELGIKPTGPHKNSPHNFSSEEILSLTQRHADSLSAKCASIQSERLQIAQQMSWLAGLIPINGSAPDCGPELRELAALMKNIPPDPGPAASYQDNARFQNAAAITMPSIAAVQRKISAKLAPKKD